MTKMRQADWGGAVINFIIIAVILLTGVLGTVYLIKQRGNQARNEQAIAQTDTENGKTNQDQVTDGSEKDASNNNAGQDDSKPSAGQTPTVLPETGMDFSIGGLITAFILSSSFVSYMLSRRELARYL
jgi:uncharacterized membrane protein (DUF485 family)